MNKKKLQVAGLLKGSIANPISKQDKQVIVTSTTVFIIFFLNLFSPFGIKNSDGNLFFIFVQSIYGLLAGAILYITEFWIKRSFRVLNRKLVRVDQIFLWYVCVTFIMSVANYRYYSLLGSLVRDNQLQFPSKTFGFFLWTTYLVAIVIGSGLILYFSSVYKSRKIVHVKNVVATKSFSSEAIEIWSENRKESFTVNVRDLLFLEKKDNYVIIYYENQDSIHKKLIRTSLKDIEDNYIKYPLYRCHVSYIINLQKVANYSGNSKGLKLVLSSGGEAVPVSSRYYDTIISEMNKLALQAPADI